MLNSYLTIKGQSEAETTVKKSKFIAAAGHFEEVAAFEEFLAKTRKARWDANHNVYAYSIGIEAEAVRQSDDGEPSQTAGVPVLEVIKGRALRNVGIIVTRYFGGTLLGAGGLARAYAEAANAAAAAAGLVEVSRMRRYDIAVGYTFLNTLQYTLPRNGFIIENTAYEADIRMAVLCAPDAAGGFEALLNDVTSGGAAVLGVEWVWHERAVIS